MGLDIGIISIKYLERPQGVAYDFSWELAHEASANGYMAGAGNNWAPFTQRQVLELLDAFAAQRAIDPTDRAGILDWVRSLPWQGWHDNLPTRRRVGDYDFVLDYNARREGGLIELHFNW